LDTDRNLLFGVLALQAELIDAARFTEACVAWTACKDRPFGDLLVERGWISLVDRAVLDRLLEIQLKQHGDAHSGLLALADEQVQCYLSFLDDAEVRNTLDTLQTQSGHVLISTLDSLPETRERYTLTRLHARGGIGQVWLAHDSALGRDVALKELRPERAANPGIGSRFLEEARITGQLEHPGIVPIYELSRHIDDEQPFYTMRFVRGRTLTEAIRAYHQERRENRAGPLDLLGLLNAFIGVCNAVAYAHSRGVIHRDLKGQNIVVGDYGEVVVLDWGLAKLVDSPDGETGLSSVALEPKQFHAATLIGQALGTPSYMAPEQAAGQLDAIDKRTDVYGLGAMLYEILTGQPPFAGSDTQEVLRRVSEDVALRPRQIDPAVPAALEAVCLMAMAKRPERRYATAAELADEVRRFLADEPVSAWREPLTIRVGRWGRRHKALVNSLAVALMVATVGLAVGYIMVGRERAVAVSQRNRAESNLALATQVVEEMYTEVAEALSDQKQMDNYQRDILEKALRFYARSVLPQSREPAVRLAAGRAGLRVAQIQGKLGREKEAIAACEEALSVLGPLDTERSSTPEYKQALATGFQTLGSLCGDVGKRDEAEAALKRAQSLAEALVAAQPAGPEYRADLAKILNDLGALYYRAERYDEAETRLDRSLSLYRELAAERSGVSPYRVPYANLLINLSLLYRDTHKFTQAEEAARAAVTSFRELLAGQPGSVAYESKLVSALNSLGGYSRDQGRPADASAAYKEALTHQERLSAAHPERIDYSYMKGAILLNLGNLENNDKGDYQTACDWYQRAVKQHELSLERQPSHSSSRQGLCFAHRGLADSLSALGRYPEALSHWDQALKFDDGLRRDRLLAYRALNLARMGSADLARTAIDNLTAKTPTHGEILYNGACVYSLSATAVIQARDVDSFASHAVELLTRTLEGNYYKAPGRLTFLRKSLRESADFASLRARPDFRTFLSDLDFPADPFTR
jgi:serine/threonine protein kinase